MASPEGLWACVDPFIMEYSYSREGSAGEPSCIRHLRICGEHFMDWGQVLIPLGCVQGSGFAARFMLAECLSPADRATLYND